MEQSTDQIPARGSPFRYAHAAASDWAEAAAACLARLEPIPAAANLGFLYASDYFADRLGELLDYFKQHTGVAHWTGTVGIAVNSTGVEYYDTPALAVMLAELPPGGFHVVGDIDEIPPGFSGHFAVLHGDPNNGHLPRLIAQFAERMTSGFVVGGLTSSRGTHAQIADVLIQGGLSGVLLSAEIDVATRLTQGCTPIGAKHRITGCDRNILISLDGRPALDVFKEDIGDVLARDLTRVAGYIFAGLAVPGSDTGDYLVRNLIGIDPPNRRLAVGAALQMGAQLMFCKRDTVAARADMLRMLEDLKRDLEAPPRGGLYYSCLGRGVHLFDEPSEELRLIRNVLGDFPLVGFYANGEISHNRLYGFTGVLTVFR